MCSYIDLLHLFPASFLTLKPKLNMGHQKNLVKAKNRDKMISWTLGLAHNTYFSACRHTKSSGVCPQSKVSAGRLMAAASAQRKVQKDHLDAKALPPPTYTHHSSFHLYMNQLSAHNCLS